MTPIEIRHFHLFVGLGGGARGFNRGRAELGRTQARFRCIGGIDVDAGALHDFQRLAGVPGTRLDLFDREQFEAFHGHRPPADWREATPQCIQRAAGDDKLVAVIQAIDGTWHRPFTTLELAALQSLLDVEDPAERQAWALQPLDGTSDSAHRERIGNAVPSAAAEAIASAMGQCLLQTWAGEGFALSSAPVWVRPAVAGLGWRWRREPRHDRARPRPLLRQPHDVV